MKKQALLAMRPLNATAKILRVVRSDVPKEVRIKYGGYSYVMIQRKYDLYLRCCIENDILKVALYYPDNLRTGGRQPSYEVYIDRSARRFVTYDRISNKWRDAMLDRLDWPSHISLSPNTWMSAADSRTVASYLKTDKRGYAAILHYQKGLREEALTLRHKKETDVWDKDLAAMPSLPKDWTRWVDKVGIPENYMFYQYEKRGAKTGYCSYCGKDIPLKDKPIHNKTGRCPRCRHEVTFKASGRMGHIETDEVSVYLIQAYPGGFILREFHAKRIYRAGNYRTPEIACFERCRTIVDQNMKSRNYYMGVYKQKDYGGPEKYPWYLPWRRED